MEEAVGGILTVRVAAAPVDGAANAALIGLLAEALGLAKGRIRLVGGESNRRKLIEVDGLEPAALRARWPGLDV